MYRLRFFGLFRSFSTEPTFADLSKALSLKSDLESLTNKKAKKTKKIKAVAEERKPTTIYVKNNPTFAQVLEQSSVLNREMIEVEKKAGELFDLTTSHEDEKLDWNAGMAAIIKAEMMYPQAKVDKEKLMDQPLIKPTFHLASVINESSVLQRMVDLNVDLSLWESRGFLGLALKLDLYKDVVPKIRFLTDMSVDARHIGRIFTENPTIFRLDVEDIQDRIDYLKSKRFSAKQITRIIVNSDSKWLNFSAINIDTNLGFLQKLFALSGPQVRTVASQEPQLVFWEGTPYQVDLNRRTLIEQMGFSELESKQLLLNCPSIYMSKFEADLEKSFNVMHNDAGFPHELLVHFPQSLLVHHVELKSRLEFLRKIGRNQFDPHQPNYVSPEALALRDDEDFCISVAKVPVKLFNQFLQTR